MFTSRPREKRIPALRENSLPGLFLAQLLKHAHILCKFCSTTPGPVTNFYGSDVLRRRFQINTMTGMGYKYKSIWDAIRVIVTQEGVQGLYKGIVPNLLKVAPSMASSWLSFEITRDLLVGMREE